MPPCHEFKKAGIRQVEIYGSYVRNTFQTISTVFYVKYESQILIYNYEISQFVCKTPKGRGNI